MKAKALQVVLAFVCGFAAIYGGMFVYQKYSRPQAPPADLPVLWPNPKTLGEFALHDQNQQPFDLKRVQDKWTFWFFGYTNCPDVCPITLSVMNQVDDQIQVQSDDPVHRQFVFVSVDPARDDPEHLGEYVEFFDDAFIGATGNADALEALARQLGILYVPGEEDEAGNYLVDHTAASLLTDPKARLGAVFTAPHKAAELATLFNRISAFVKAAG